MSSSKVTGNDQEKGSRRKRLTRDENESCRWLGYIFFTPDKYLKPTRSQRQRASLHYRRAIEDAGLEYKEPKDWSDVRETFRAVILELDAKQITSSSAHTLKRVADEYYKGVCDQWDAERKAAKQIAAAGTTRTHPNSRDDLAAFGILKGDEVEAIETTLAELKHGDLIIIMDAEGKTVEGVGRFDKIEDDYKERDGARLGVFWVDEPDASYYYNTSALWRIERIVATTRKIEIGKMTDAAAAAAQREAKIAALRGRLEKLTEDDEITTCSARFTLEKQIYDLEHEQTTPADEWEGFDLVSEGGTNR